MLCQRIVEKVQLGDLIPRANFFLVDPTGQEMESAGLAGESNLLPDTEVWVVHLGPNNPWIKNDTKELPIIRREHSRIRSDALRQCLTKFDIYLI